MKAVMISIRPKWAEKIINGEKTIEVRKSRPKLEPPFKCYIYCCKAKDDYNIFQYWESEKTTRLDGKVIGEFVCDYIVKYVPISTADKGYIGYYIPIDTDKDCLSEKYRLKYGKGKYLYGWHISDLKFYGWPRELGEFSLFEKKDCKHYYCGKCDESDTSHVIRCENLHCEHKRVTRPPQSWFYIEV